MLLPMPGFLLKLGLGRELLPGSHMRTLLVWHVLVVAVRYCTSLTLTLLRQVSARCPGGCYHWFLSFLGSTCRLHLCMHVCPTHTPHHLCECAFAKQGVPAGTLGYMCVTRCSYDGCCQHLVPTSCNRRCAVLNNTTGRRPAWHAPPASKMTTRNSTSILCSTVITLSLSQNNMASRPNVRTKN